MIRKRTIICIIVALICLPLMHYAFAASDNDKIRIAGNFMSADSLKVWIFFTDKGNDLIPLSKTVTISDKAMIRRSLRGSNIDNDFLDRDVNPSYISQIAPIVRRICQQSRWLNAISAYVHPDSISAVAALECVKEIRRVTVYTRKLEPIPDTSAVGLEKPLAPYPPDYGPSFAQLSQIQVVDLHERGLTGQGVTILILDTGFKLTHPVFSRLDVDSTWDFINGDVDVEDSTDIPRLAQQDHGTMTLSVIGGYALGAMLGAAYDAKYLVAKSEIATLPDIRAEEDWWVAAMEWGERLGADVASSSLGYPDFYTWEDLDGNTAVTTIAADHAASLGVIVVNALGNEHRDSPKPTLIPPADGDSVIGVGAVDIGGTIADFSSNGPTVDGRIKPDLCAMGVGDRVASYLGDYRYGSGTSFATPLVAGTIALLLQAHPSWDYGKVYQALTRTATKAASPDTVYGYGIVQALEALSYFTDSTLEVSGVVAFPNPFRNAVDFRFEMASSGTVCIRIYSVAGEKVAEVKRQYSITRSRVVTIPCDGSHGLRSDLASGVYIAYITGPGINVTKKIVKL